MARRRSSFHPPLRVPLSPEEAAEARLLAGCAIRLQVRTEAQELLDIGADPDALRDLRISCTSSLCGDEACLVWGASVTPAAIVAARRRVRQGGLVDGALYLAVLYCVGRTAPKPLYLSGGSGLGGGPGTGLAWTCGSGVDPSIQVRRHPPAVQGELWDADGCSWMELAQLRDTYWASVSAAASARSVLRR